MQKTSIFCILGQNGQFWTVFGQNGQNGNFFKKELGTFFLRLQALTNCKVSEKSNERFSSNRVTHGRTDERTRILKSPTSRETKKTTVQKIKKKTNFYPKRYFPRVKIVLSNENNFEPIWRKVEKPHYLAFLRR